MKLPKPNESSFESAPVGNHIGVCFRLIDLGTTTEDTPWGIKRRRQVVVGFELVNTEMEDGRPYTINKWYTFSMHEKATLRHDLESWRGRPFSREDFDTFNLANILGKPCMVNVVAKDNGGTKIADITAYPKGMPTQECQSPQEFFDLEERNLIKYQNLPDWLQERISESEEYIAWQNTGPSNPAPSTVPQDGPKPAHDPIEDDASIPF